MRGFFILIFTFVLFLFGPGISAQNNSSPSPRTELPFLIPQTIFVGDPGRLVVPLGQAYAGVDPFVVEANLPETPELTIRRIELERRGGLSRLLIDFIPYVPGLITFPPLEFLSPQTRPLGALLPVLTDLEVQVASILSPSEMALSDPASPLAVPGTSFLVYGTLSLVFLILFFGIGGSIWGRRHFSELWERFRRRRLLRLMIKFLQRLRQESFFEGKEKPGYYLSLLSAELREFLSYFTGTNCRSLTSGEFLDLSLGYETAGAENTDSTAFHSGGEAHSTDPEHTRLLSPAFLCNLFSGWDTLRFNGKGVDRVEMFLALKEAGDFIAALDRAEREKPLRQSNREASVNPALLEEG